MLDQVAQWMNAASTVVEAILLFRVLSLRLFRPYTFITLYCVLSVLFDSISWWLGWNTNAAQQAGIIQWFFLALLAPLTAWEAFDEIAVQIAKLRRFQAGRLISGVLLTLVLLVLAFASFSAPDNPWAVAAMIGLMCWTGFASASFAFIWFTWRSIRAEKIELTNNTFVWTVFFIATDLIAIVYCFLLILALSGIAKLQGPVLVLQCVDVLVMCWCIYKLKRSANLVRAVSANEQ